MTCLSQRPQVLDRGGKSSRLVAQLSDEPGIFNRDDRLVGKDGDKIDLLDP